MCKVCVHHPNASVCCLKVRSQVLQQNRKKLQKDDQKLHKIILNNSTKKLEKGNGVNCVCDWPRSVAHSMITATASSSPSAKTQLKSAISSGLGIDLRARASENRKEQSESTKCESRTADFSLRVKTGRQQCQWAQKRQTTVQSFFSFFSWTGHEETGGAPFVSIYSTVVCLSVVLRAEATTTATVKSGI